MSQQDFDDIINNNEMIENTQIPTGGKWSEDGKSYSDRYGTIWRGDAANPGKLYAHIGGTEKEWSEVYGSDVPMPTYTPPTGTTGGYGGDLTGSSTPVVTPSRAAGAAPSGYADYLKGDGKGVAEGFDQAVAAARAEYERNRATFGARAESLGRAGLTGSGYGDYLEGKAFTAMQQKIGAAETAKAQSYADYLTQKEAQASSYAAYLSSEQQAEEEKVKTVANKIVYNARSNNLSSVTVESMILDAKAAGVTLTDEWLASIKADLESVGIKVVTQAEAANESLYQTMVGYIEDGGPARTVDDLIAVIKTYDPNISDESARAIADRLAPTIAEKDKQVADENDANRAAVIKAIKEWATSGDTIPTIEQIKNEAKTNGGIELTDEDMADISAYVKGETGAAPLTMEDAVEASVNDWVITNAEKFDNVNQMVLAMESTKQSPEKIEAAKQMYFSLHSTAVSDKIDGWTGSASDLSSLYSVENLDAMIDKTITKEQAAELKEKVSAKLYQIAEKAYSTYMSGEDDEAVRSALGIDSEQWDEMMDEERQDAIFTAVCEIYNRGAMSESDVTKFADRFVKETTMKRELGTKDVGQLAIILKDNLPNLWYKYKEKLLNVLRDVELEVSESVYSAHGYSATAPSTVYISIPNGDNNIGGTPATYYEANDNIENGTIRTTKFGQLEIKSSGKWVVLDKSSFESDWGKALIELLMEKYKTKLDAETAEKVGAMYGNDISTAVTSNRKQSETKTNSGFAEYLTSGNK